MIRDITIGQYYQGSSLIHRLDPRLKVVGVLVYLISLFCFRYVIGFLVAGLFFVLVLRLSKVPFRYVIKGLKPILFLLIFTAALNLLWTPGVWHPEPDPRGNLQVYLYGTSSDSSDHRFITADADYNAESVDGCHGASAGTVETLWGTGA